MAYDINETTIMEMYEEIFTKYGKIALSKQDADKFIEYMTLFKVPVTAFYPPEGLVTVTRL